MYLKKWISPNKEKFIQFTSTWPSCTNYKLTWIFIFCYLKVVCIFLREKGCNGVAIILSRRLKCKLGHSMLSFYLFYSSLSINPSTHCQSQPINHSLASLAARAHSYSIRSRFPGIPRENKITHFVFPEIKFNFLSFAWLLLQNLRKIFWQFHTNKRICCFWKTRRLYVQEVILYSISTKTKTSWTYGMQEEIDGVRPTIIYNRIQSSKKPGSGSDRHSYKTYRLLLHLL